MLDMSRTPEQSRRYQLTLRDKRERQRQRLENETLSAEDLEYMNTFLKPLHGALRGIDIIGQIVQSRKGSLETEVLIPMISMAYLTAFKVIRYCSSFLSEMKPALADLIVQETDGPSDLKFIEREIGEFIQKHLYDVCINIFEMITASVGNKDLKNLYGAAAMRIDSPASRLVSFWIQSSYGTIRVKDIKSLRDELKGNPVALHLLKIDVLSYLYNNHLDFKTKQQLAASIGLLSARPLPFSDAR